MPHVARYGLNYPHQVIATGTFPILTHHRDVMNDAAPIYSHRQIGWVILGALGIALLVIAHPTLILIPEAEIFKFAILSILPAVILGWMFSTLTVRVENDRVEWWFGPGWWSYTIRPSEIEAVHVTKTSGWEGWGIRYTSQGWLYNVSGFEAVGIEKADGSYVRIGSDEPDRLQRAIDRARGNTSDENTHLGGSATTRSGWQ